jgi:hypothetical protein
LGASTFVGGAVSSLTESAEIGLLTAIGRKLGNCAPHGKGIGPARQKCNRQERAKDAKIAKKKRTDRFSSFPLALLAFFASLALNRERKCPYNPPLCQPGTA